MISKAESAQARILTWFILLAVLLTSCGESVQSTTQPTQAGPQPAAGSTRQPGCSVVVRQPTTGPTQEALLPPPSDEDWSRGPADASITIIEYSDFQ